MPATRAKPRLGPWRVTALPLGPLATIDLLCGVADRPTLAPGVLVGGDLAFWAKGLRLAASLVARQQFLPGVTEQEGTYRACWEPVFAAADAERLAELARRMPAVARAMSDPETTAPPEPAAVDLLKRFSARMVDQLVRSSLPEAGADRGRRRARPAKTERFESVHDQWLHALRHGDGTMQGAASELAEFAEQAGRWRRPISVSTAAPFRLCFRLEEPTDGNGEAGRETSGNEDLDATGDGRGGTRAGPRDPSGAPGDGWYVRYLLQAADDPSLLVPVSDAWQGGRRKASVLRRRGFRPQEYLLSSLGQASGICPRIEASLKSAQPAGYGLDIAGAHEFLTERAVALEQAGFGVMLPAWWTRTGTKQHLSVRATIKSPRMQGGSGLSLDEMVKFDWEVVLGGKKIDPRELERLARAKQPLVRVRGQWVEVNAEQIHAALDYWKEKAKEKVSAREVVQMAVGAASPPGELGFEGVKATGWVGKLVRQLEGDAALEEQSAPDAFQGTLRPYQVRGYSWLAFLRRWGLGACLADDMGLGKTIQTLVLIQRDWQLGQKRPVLLICPTSVVSNWQKEAARFTPDLPVMVHHGIKRAKHAAFVKAAAEQAIVVSSYALLHRDLEYLAEVDWAGVVLDEAQNVKNPETKQARAARSLRADYRVALTGTPVENHVGDLWSIMEFLNPGLLGTQAAFKRTFFVPIQAGRDPEAARRLKRITGPFILRRLKTDKKIISDLPEKLEMKVFCTLTKEQASLYAAVVKEAEKALEETDDEGIQRKGVILGTLSKLKQVCNHPAQFLGDGSSIPGRSGKLARLAEMVEELIEVGDRALVFTQFREMGDLLARHLQETFGREVLFLHGGVTKRKRDELIARFQADDGPPVFLLSLKAGGTGLNLTRANHVFHFDRWWNPAVENQATDRAFRIGQTRNVQVHKFLCAGTLEEKIDEMIERKKAVAEDVVGTGEGWLANLSNRELKEVFALRKEAVGA
jgi:SNF2 family DNA or RNA helicase